MIFKRHKKPEPKTCVVGLDGVPHSMLTRFMEAGVMPNTRDIVAEGVITPMTVTLPEISSVSWSSFMTGKNPGEHGIFGFTDIDPRTYKQVFPSFRDLKTETIWDLIGKADKRSVVINQPATYPARPIKGALVSGFVAIQLERSVYPPRYIKTLKELDYTIDLDTLEVHNDPPKLFVRLAQLLDSRRRLVDMLWKEEEWDLMEVIVTGTDRLHHFVFDAYEDTSHPHHKDFLDYYSKVDEFVGYVHGKFLDTGFGDNFFLLSDHGFCRTRKEVYVNTVLAQNGFLTLPSPDTKSLDDITADTTAFGLDPARIYIHRSGRFARGGVADAETTAIKEKIKTIFEGLRDGETPVIRKVFDGTEAYSGPHADKGPDLLLVPHNGYDLKGRVGADTIIGERRLQGMHTWDDAFFATKQKNLLQPSDTFNLLDIPPLILKSLDVT